MWSMRGVLLGAGSDSGTCGYLHQVVEGKNRNVNKTSSLLSHLILVTLFTRIKCG